MADHREHPVLFAGPLVRAILEGRKTQTRRVVTPRNTIAPRDAWPIHRHAHAHDGLLRHPWDGGLTVYLPRWQPGDRLWVREAWVDDCPMWPHWCGCGSTDMQAATHKVRYAADVAPGTPAGGCRAASKPGGRWMPSIHMPRWASRITLEIESIRPERLTKISEADAQAEGVTPFECIAPDQTLCEPGDTRTQATHPHVIRFASLWDSINGTKTGHAWRDDPWVWVTTFRRLET